VRIGPAAVPMKTATPQIPRNWALSSIFGSVSIAKLRKRAKWGWVRKKLCERNASVCEWRLLDARSPAIQRQIRSVCDSCDAADKHDTVHARHEHERKLSNRQYSARSVNHSLKRLDWIGLNWLVG